MSFGKLYTKINGELKAFNATISGIPAGGKAGQLLFKASYNDYDYVWKYIKDTKNLVLDEWTQVTLPVTGNWTCLEWSSKLNLYCALAYDSNICITSTDGTNWTQHTMPYSGKWIDICWFDSYSNFQACTDDNKIAASSDGINWSGSDSGLTYAPEIMCYSKFLDNIVGLRSATKVFYFYSASWYGRKYMPSTGYTDMCSADEVGVICSVGSSSLITISSTYDADDAANKTSPITADFKGVAWSPSLSMLCIIAYNSNQCLTSTDKGNTWTARTLPSTANWRYIEWSSNLGVFCIIADTSNKVAYSVDGINWKERNILSSSADWRSVRWSPSLGRFLAISYNSNIAAISSASIS